MMLGMQNQSRGVTTDDTAIDSPCWGSPSRCSLADLLEEFNRSIILLETDDYIVLNKPPDLRMDGDYPATVHKLLTFWYPPKSLASSPNLLDSIAKLTKANDLRDNQLRPCHQLDYATSGALLVGRNRAAAGRACEAFRDRTTQKLYLALVHSHVTIPSNNCPKLSLSQQDLVDLYIRRFDKELADRRKARRKTFAGFQPPSSIFMKWKDFTRRGGSTSFVKRPRDVDLMHRVEREISQHDRELMSCMAWGDVKLNDRWSGVFQTVSEVYNQALLEEIVDSRSSKCSRSETLNELPTVFQLEQDVDENAFYVNVPLAQHPTNFAMVIHPSSQKSSSNLVLDPFVFDYKLAITRCKILKHSMLKGSPVTKLKLQPLTGRRHQLRCHMVVVGAPIIGDVTYEGENCPKDLTDRMCLHAFQLKVPGIVQVEAPDPFVSLLKEEKIDINKGVL